MAGGCLCGAVRLTDRPPILFRNHCHCHWCRRAHGAAFVTWFSVLRSHFQLVRGEPARFRSTAKATRSFCPQCGTQLTFEHEDFSGEIDVTTCSLDNPEALPPTDHTRTSSKLSWIQLADGLPRYGHTGNNNDCNAPEME